MTDAVLYGREGHVVVLTLNRPETRNAISDDDMIDGLVDAAARINGDDGVRAAILTGAGPAFCSGGNVKRMAEPGGLGDGPPAAIRATYRRGIQRIPRALYDLEVPLIAAVNGPAIGAGCDLACLCDIRIAAESARFAESFVRLGIIPGDGGAWLLPRIVGLSKACELTFTGDSIAAAEALACGLVSRVVPDDRLLDEARALAARIAANPPQALRLAKRLIREGQHTTLDTLLELSASMQALAHHTADHKEALAARRDKRPPTFTGE